MSELSSGGSPAKKAGNIPSNWAQKWSDEEDKRLLMGIEQYGENNWRLVAQIVGTRDPVKCMQRWEKGLKPGIIKGRWSEEEDRALVYLVSQGYKNWGQVAQHMPGRTSKQCRERWNNYLDPTLIHTPFSEEEDSVLLSLQSQHGNKWALIARHIPGRTENAVKLRYHAIVKKVHLQNVLNQNAQAIMTNPSNGSNETRINSGALQPATNVYSAPADHGLGFHLTQHHQMGASRMESNSAHENDRMAILYSSYDGNIVPRFENPHHPLLVRQANGVNGANENHSDVILQQQQHIQHQQQHQMYLANLRENNDNRHPLSGFHFQQQHHQPTPQQIHLHQSHQNNSYTGGYVSDELDQHHNKRQRVDVGEQLPQSFHANGLLDPTLLQHQHAHQEQQLHQLHLQRLNGNSNSNNSSVNNNSSSSNNNNDQSENSDWVHISQAALQIDDGPNVDEIIPDHSNDSASFHYAMQQHYSALQNLLPQPQHHHHQQQEQHFSTDPVAIHHENSHSIHHLNSITNNSDIDPSDVLIDEGESRENQSQQSQEDGDAERKSDLERKSDVVGDGDGEVEGETEGGDVEGEGEDEIESDELGTDSNDESGNFEDS